MIIGWSIADHVRIDRAVDALQIARWRRNPDPSWILYSDMRAQVTSWILGYRLREAPRIDGPGRLQCRQHHVRMDSGPRRRRNAGHDRGGGLI